LIVDFADYCSAISGKQKNEADVKKEIQGVIRQITASVTFLPLLESPCKFCSQHCVAPIVVSTVMS